MDLSMIIPGFLILASVVVPIVYLNGSKTRAEKKLVKVAHGFAAFHNFNVSQYEVYQNIMLGIDENAAKLFYVNQKKGETIKMAINLSEMDKCSIVETKNNNQAIDRLEWVFANKNPSKAAVVLEFYNAKTTNFSLGEEADLLRKWQEIVAVVINKAK
jgi:hypothetical protein